MEDKKKKINRDRRLSSTCDNSTGARERIPRFRSPECTEDGGEAPNATLLAKLVSRMHGRIGF